MYLTKGDAGLFNGWVLLLHGFLEEGERCLHVGFGLGPFSVNWASGR